MKKTSLLFGFCTFALGVLANNPLKLTYDKPAQYFEETLVIGNGNIGAAIYGGVDEERISLNDITLWTGEPEGKVYSPQAHIFIPKIREALFAEDYRMADKLQRNVQGHYTSNYQPLGTLTFTSDKKESTGYSRTLDIANSIASVVSGNMSRDYFASAPDSVIVIRLRAKDGEKLNHRFHYDSQLPHHTIVDGAELVTDGYAAYYSLPNYIDGSKHSFLYDSNRGIHFRTIVRIVNKDGNLKEVNGNELSLSDCTEALIIISNVTSFNGADRDPVKEGRNYKDDVRRRIDEAAKKDYDALYASHLNDYKKLFDSFSINLGTTSTEIARKTTDRQLLDYTDNKEHNPDLEELYVQYGRYLLISCSRTDEVPANLQGLWNEKILPPWSSNYTSNINVQENYWPAEIAGLGALHAPLLGFIGKLPLTGATTAKSYYGVGRGWCLGQNTDIWATTNPVGMNGGDPVWANWNMGGAWISTHLWEHYAFSMDKDYLRRVFPVLKGASDFCMAWMIEHDGHLMTAPSTSPEAKYKINGNGKNSKCEGYAGASLYGGAADVAMIRECLLDTRRAAKEIGYSKAYVDSIDEVLKHLLPYRIGKRGNLQEWYYDWDDNEVEHRHQSHLYGLYPGHHITLADNPDLVAAAKRTLELKGRKTTGWSSGWRINLWARMHEAEEAYGVYRMLLNYITPDAYRGPGRRKGGGTYPNLLDAHSPFQIDGNFGGCAGVIEMLVQSEYNEDGTILVNLLPALPAAWKAEGSIKGVRIRGGLELSIAWKNGKVTSLSLTSLRKDKCRVKVVGGGYDKRYTIKPSKH